VCISSQLNRPHLITSGTMRRYNANRGIFFGCNREPPAQNIAIYSWLPISPMMRYSLMRVHCHDWL